MWALIAVTVPFSFAIAILKDVPDIEGDRRYAIATFSVRLGARRVLALGVARARPLGRAGHGGRRAAPARRRQRRAARRRPPRGAGRAVARGRRASTSPTATPITVFYQRVWKLFFLEYAIVAAAYLLG